MSRRSTQSAVTAREREVLSLIEAHLTNGQIADELCLSVRTVESHVSSLMRKLQVTDRRSLARRAERVGLGRPADHGRWPAEVSSFIGRESERDDLLAAVAEHRMVTVTGPGGVGKTRLARLVARELAATRADGGWFVDLVRVTDPDMVDAAVAAVIGVVEPPGGSLSDAVAAALSGSDGVLLLDNCEHVLGAAGACVRRLLTSCPGLQVTVTSRVRLGAPFEWVYEVPGLSVVDGGGDAVRLFLERATAAGSTTEIDPRQISTLCRALDGMALAVELAAGRYPSLGIDGLLASLDHRLRYLTSGASGDHRHRSLADAIAWSYDLLGPSDQTLIGAVSVFASWFDVDAAAAIAEASLTRSDVADTLARLADHHLVVVAPGQPTRYRVLETIRQYADDRLSDTAQNEARARHRAWCRARLRVLSGESHDDTWCRHLDQAADDVRAAIGWAAEHRIDAAVADLAEPLAQLLLLRGQLAEAQRRYEQAARHALAGQDRVRLLRLAAGAAAARVTGNDTLRLLDEATTAALAIGDRDGAAAARAWMVIYLNMMSGIMAVRPTAEEGARWLADARRYATGSPAVEAAIGVAFASGLPDTDPDSTELATRARVLARDAQEPLVESVALDQLCAVFLARGDLSGAIEVVRRRGEVLEPLPLDASTAYQFNDFLLMAAEIHLAAGDLTEAGRYADRLAGLATYREQSHLATSRRIKVDAMAGDLDRAAEQGEQFLAAWERAGRPIAGTLNVTTYALAMVHALRGDDEARHTWTEVTLALTADPERLHGCRTGFAPTFDGLVALDRDQPEVALARLSADVDDREVWGAWIMGLWRPWYAALWVEAAVLAGHPDVADRLRRGAAATRENPIAAAIVRRADACSRGDHTDVATFPGTFAALGCHYQERRSEQLLRKLAAPPR